MTILERINAKKAGTEKAPASGVSKKEQQKPLSTPYADAAQGNTILERIRNKGIEAAQPANLYAQAQNKLRRNDSLRGNGARTWADDTQTGTTGAKQPVMSYSQMQKTLAQKLAEQKDLETNSTYSPIALAALYDNIPTQEQWEAEQQQKRTDLQGQIDALQGNIQKEDALRSNRLGRVQNNRTLYAEQLAEYEQQKAEAEAKPEIARRGPTPGKNVRAEHEEQLAEARSNRNTTNMLKRLQEIKQEINQLDDYWKTYGENQRNTGIMEAFNPDADFGPEELLREDYNRQRDALTREQDAIEKEYRIIKGQGPYEGKYAKYLNYAQERDSAFDVDEMILFLKEQDPQWKAYRDIANADDFSKFARADARKAWDEEDAPNNVNEKGYAWEVYDYLNNIDGAREKFDERSWTGNGPEYAKYQLMTKDEILRYNYIFNKEGAGAALQYLNYLEPQLNRQMYTGRQEAVDEWVGKNAATKIVGGTLTSAAMPAREILSVAAGIQDAWRAITGKGIDSYSELHQFLRIVQGVRAEITEDMGATGSFLTNTAFSAADSFMNARIAYALAGALGYTGDAAMEVANKIGAPLMSSEVFASEVAAAKDKGYSDAGAMMLACIRSGIETATELIGGEKVIELIKKNPESFLWSMFLSAAPEGLEEVMGGAANEGINLLIDNIFGTEESFIGQAYRDAVANGENPYAAVAKAILIQTSLDFAGGALASVGSSYVSTAHYQNALESSAKAIGSDKGNVINLMKELDTENPALVEALSEKYGTTDANEIKDNYQNDLQRGADALGTDVETVKKLMKELKTEDPAAVAELAELFDITDADDFRTMAKQIRKAYDQFNRAMAAMRENMPTTPGTNARAERAAQEEEYRQHWEARRQALDNGDKETAEAEAAWLKEAEKNLNKSPVEILTGVKQYEAKPTVDPRAEERAQMEEEQRRQQDLLNQDEGITPPVEGAEPRPGVDVRAENDAQLQEEQQAWTENGGVIPPVVGYETVQNKENGGMIDGEQGYSGEQPGNDRERAGGEALGDEGRAVSVGMDAGDAEGQRRHRFQDLVREKVTDAALGVANGSTTATVDVLDDSRFETGSPEARAAQKARDAGLEPVFVTGTLQIGDGENAKKARAYIKGNRVILQADARVTAEQLLDHELYHQESQRNKELNGIIREALANNMDEQELRDLVGRYITAYDGIYDFSKMSQEEIEAKCEEELFADLYAGIDNTGKQELRETAKKAYAEAQTREQQNAEAERETRGPPEGRASYAGVNAKTADSQSLSRAEQMERDGSSNEEIRQATGWYRGMDGQWRFEIDDSGAKFSRRGDLMFRQSEPGYNRFRELIEKAEAYMLGNSDKWLTEAEQEELTRLQAEWGDYFRQAGKPKDNSNVRTRLADYLKHDKLFEAYPELRNALLVFRDMENGVKGAYNPRTNTITLSNDLRAAAEDTLIHEIQHAVQAVEGFSGGASQDLWLAKKNNARETARDARRELYDYSQDLMHLEGEYGRGEVTEDEYTLRLNEMLGTDPRLKRLYDAYRSAAHLAELVENQSADQLYRNTAGEIEARDTANRRSMTAEERKNTPPDLGDENTVFAVGNVPITNITQNAYSNIPITANMNEEERYNVLKNREIELRAKANNEKLTEIETRIGQSSAEAETLKETEKKKLFKKIGEEFHVFTDYENRDINLTFGFSKNNMRESTNKQSQNYSDFAKMLSCLPDIIDTAVGIEVHNRNEQGYKSDPTLKNVFVLVSAFEDGNRVVPVKLEVKEFKDKANALYVAVTLDSIKKDEVVKQGNDGKNVSEGAQSSRSSMIRLSDLFRKINTNDKSFLKYVPQQFFAESNTNNGVQLLQETAPQFQTWDGSEGQEAQREEARAFTEGIDIMPEAGEEAISSANGLTDEDNADLDARNTSSAPDGAPSPGGEGFDDGGLSALFGPTYEEQEIKATERATTEGNAALKEFADSMPEDPMDLYQQQNPVNSNGGSNGGDNNGPKKQPGYEKMNTERAPEKKTLGQRISDAWHRFIRSMVNEADAIHQAGRATGNKALDGMYFYAKAAMQRAQQWIQGQRMNFDLSESGKGLNEIFDPIRAKGEDYYKKFQLYMYHMLNVERMSRSSKAELEAAQQRVDELASMDPSIATMNQDQLKEKARQYREGGGLGYFDMEENGELIAQYWEAVKERDRLLNQQNKPVFGFDTDADQSRQIARDLLADNPEFEKLAQEVYDYVDALLQYRVDAGLITPEDMNRLKETYPHYIPVMYKMQQEDTGRQKKGNIKADDAIMRAKGGSQEMEPLHLALARQTLAVMKNAGYQQLGSEILKEYYDNRAAMSRYVTDVTENEAVWDETAADNDDVNVPFENVVSVIRDGKRYDITLSDDMSYAFKSLQPSKQRLQDWKAMVKANDLFKKLCTAWNPLFMITNPVRDVQDALFYSTDTKRWMKNYPKAIAQIAKSGRYWKMYQAMGGVNNSYFDWATGENSGKMGKVEALNMAIEQAPRLAEFMTVLENAERINGTITQADLMEAFNAAAEITTNFSRSGTMGKWINRNLVPFWNPGVQGLSKAVRTVSETKGFKAWAVLALKAAALGMLPALLNGLLYKDDDEWDKIDDQMKMEYYLFKTKDGVWIKIPKGRMLAALSAPVVGAQEAIRGDDVDWFKLGKQAFGSVAPNNPLETNLLSTAKNANPFNKDDPGKTWYGSNIESQRLQNYAPGQRYDESTDVISKWLGGKLNLSPKKINYILDQYSGVIGDLVLPYLTPKAERGISAEIGGKDVSVPFSNAFMSRFTLDTVTNNTISGEYYDMLDELGFAAKGGDNPSAIAERYMNRAGGKVSEIYAKIREIENDQNLSDREKTQLTRELRKQLNEYQQQVIRDAGEYLATARDFMDEHPGFDYSDDKAVDAFVEGYNSLQTNEKYMIDADQAVGKMKDEVYREVNREHFGAEYALQVYNKDVYAKAQAIHDESGLSYDDYYDFYFGTRYMYADKDEDGQSISGSKKEKIVGYIDGMDITDEQKDALYLSKGYTENSLNTTPWHGGSGSYATGGGQSTGKSGSGSSAKRTGSGSGKSSGGKTKSKNASTGTTAKTAKRTSSGTTAETGGSTRTTSPVRSGKGIQTSTASDLIKIIDEMYGGNELAALVDDRKPKGRTKVNFKL